MKRWRITTMLTMMTIGLLAAGTAQAQSSPLAMTANLDRISVGEPVTFTITKTNVLPSDHDWHVRDFLPAGVEFVSATSSQGSCALESATELGIPSTDVNDSGVVQCDLGIIPSGDWATMDVTVTPTVPGEITTYATDNAENQASATVTVE